MRFAALVVVCLMLVPTSAHAETLVFKASQAGKETLDQGEGGGNPFASSLIEILSRPSARLGDLPAELRRLTLAKSRDFQLPDVPPQAPPEDWALVPAKSGELRKALVLVVSDYAKSGGAPSLPGVAHDASRVAAALSKVGFATEIAIDLDLFAMRRRLDAFASETKNADAAVIYTTGHGVEVGAKIYLVPGGYPIAEGNRSLADKALPLPEIAAAVRARRINLVFYGGCRNDPLAP